MIRNTIYSIEAIRKRVAERFPEATVKVIEPQADYFVLAVGRSDPDMEIRGGGLVFSEGDIDNGCHGIKDYAAQSIAALLANVPQPDEPEVSAPQSVFSDVISTESGLAAGPKRRARKPKDTESSELVSTESSEPVSEEPVAPEAPIEESDPATSVLPETDGTAEVTSEGTDGEQSDEQPVL